MRQNLSPFEKFKKEAYIIVYGTHTFFGRLFDLILLLLIVITNDLLSKITTNAMPAILEKAKGKFVISKICKISHLQYNHIFVHPSFVIGKKLSRQRFILNLILF